MRLSLGLVAAPFILTDVPEAQMRLWHGFVVDTMQEAAVTSVIGLILGIISVWLINSLASALGFISVWALGRGA